MNSDNTHYLCLRNPEELSSEDVAKYFWDYNVLATAEISGVVYVLLQDCSKERWEALQARFTEISRCEGEKRDFVISTSENKVFYYEA